MIRDEPSGLIPRRSVAGGAVAVGANRQDDAHGSLCGLIERDPRCPGDYLDRRSAPDEREPHPGVSGRRGRVHKPVEARRRECRPTGREKVEGRCFSRNWVDDLQDRTNAHRIRGRRPDWRHSRHEAQLLTYRGRPQAQQGCLLKEVRGEGHAIQKKGRRQPGRYPSFRHLASFRACEERGESRGCACACATAMPLRDQACPLLLYSEACRAARSSRPTCGPPERATASREATPT